MNPLLLAILKKAPEIFVIAKKLADSVKAGKHSVSVADRVAALEKNEAQQAELVKEMAQQLDAMTVLMKALSVRLTLALTGAFVALLLAVVALVNSYAK